MTRRPLLSADSAPIQSGKGKLGNVRLNVDVDPELKDRLVKVALHDGVPLAAVVRDALDFYLDGVRR